MKPQQQQLSNVNVHQNPLEACENTDRSMNLFTNAVLHNLHCSWEHFWVKTSPCSITNEGSSFGKRLVAIYFTASLQSQFPPQAKSWSNGRLLSEWHSVKGGTVACSPLNWSLLAGNHSLISRGKGSRSPGILSVFKKGAPTAQPFPPRTSPRQQVFGVKVRNAAPPGKEAIHLGAGESGRPMTRHQPSEWNLCLTKQGCRKEKWSWFNCHRFSTFLLNFHWFS